MSANRSDKYEVVNDALDHLHYALNGRSHTVRNRHRLALEATLRTLTPAAYDEYLSLCGAVYRATDDTV